MPPESWIARAEESGGRIIREVCHFVDLCAHLADSSIAEVSVTRSAAGPDDVMIGLRMANGSIATVAYMIDGDRAASKAHRGVRRRTPRDNRRFSACTRPAEGAAIEARGYAGAAEQGHAAEVSAFVRAVSSRTAPSPVSLDSAINTTRHVRDRPVARSGGPVRVP